MWRQFWAQRYAWYLLLLGVVSLLALLLGRREKRSLQAFARENGFAFQENVDPLELGLYETAFFGRFDTARNVVSGRWKGVIFAYFEHGRVSGRGSRRATQTVVAFAIGVKGLGHPPRTPVDGWSLSKSSTYLFMLRETDAAGREKHVLDAPAKPPALANGKNPPYQELLDTYLIRFIDAAYSVYRQALE
jgi:hypothetical protein